MLKVERASLRFIHYVLNTRSSFGVGPITAERMSYGISALWYFIISKWKSCPFAPSRSVRKCEWQRLINWSKSTCLCMRKSYNQTYWILTQWLLNLYTYLLGEGSCVNSIYHSFSKGIVICFTLRSLMRLWRRARTRADILFCCTSVFMSVKYWLTLC